MKVLIALSLLAAIALAKPKHDLGRLNIKEVSDKCQEDPEFHIETSVFKKIRRGSEDVVIPENYGKHILCIAKGMGIMGGDGKINEEVLKVHVALIEQDSAKQETITKECSEGKATSEETALSLWACLSKNQILGAGHKTGRKMNGEHRHH